MMDVIFCVLPRGAASRNDLISDLDFIETNVAALGLEKGFGREAQRAARASTAATGSAATGGGCRAHIANGKTDVSLEVLFLRGLRYGFGPSDRRTSDGFE